MGEVWIWNSEEKFMVQFQFVELARYRERTRTGNIHFLLLPPEMLLQSYITE